MQGSQPCTARAPRSDLPFRRRSPTRAMLAAVRARSLLAGCAGPQRARLRPAADDHQRRSQGRRRAAPGARARRARPTETPPRRATARSSRATREDPLVPIAQLALGRLLLAKDQLPAAKREFEQVGKHPGSGGRRAGPLLRRGRRRRGSAITRRAVKVLAADDRPADRSRGHRACCCGRWPRRYIGLARYGDAAITLDTLAAPSAARSRSQLRAHAQRRARARQGQREPTSAGSTTSCRTTARPGRTSCAAPSATPMPPATPSACAS